MQLQLLQAAKDELQTVGYTATLARAKPLSTQQAGYTVRIRRSTLHDASDLHGPVTKLAESGAALLESLKAIALPSGSGPPEQPPAVDFFLPAHSRRILR